MLPEPGRHRLFLGIGGDDGVIADLLEGSDSGVDDVAGGTPTPADADAPPGIAAREDQVILEQADLDAWLARLQAAEAFCFDLETTSLNYMEAQIVGVGLALQAGEAVSMAAGEPAAPMATPMSAWASAGVSLTPSPTMATVWP